MVYYNLSWGVVWLYVPHFMKRGFSDIIYRKPKWKHHGGIKIKTLVWLAVGARRKVRGYSVFRIHPLGTVNMWPQIHCNQSNNCWDFSVWIKEVNQTTDWYSHLWIHVASIPSNDLLLVKQRTKEVILEGQNFLSLCSVGISSYHYVNVFE